ncbi:hypothetical protein [Flavobacterium sp.]|uniref:hypothetical protein n=1 Tax=Flavobacterium sp. TaxID=239 RepID=UPI0026081592|nr:hypothetical protein [Flavobacterium sp.]
MKILIAFLFSISLSAQTKMLDVKIDSITTNDSNPKKRAFTINYHIENLTENEISFFLRPNTLIANAASSLTLYPIYRIYQNSSFIALDGPFYEREGNDEWNKYVEMTDKKTPEAKELLQKIMDEHEAQKNTIIDDYKKNGGKNTDELWIIKNHNQWRAKITLQPKEIKSFQIKTSWDKERYILQDDLEYYLDEKDKFEIELTLHLIKTHFKERLSPEEFTQIEKDKNFIEGIFTSNKVEINFN